MATCGTILRTTDIKNNNKKAKKNKSCMQLEIERINCEMAEKKRMNSRNLKLCKICLKFFLSSKQKSFSEQRRKKEGE